MPDFLRSVAAALVGLVVASTAGAQQPELVSVDLTGTSGNNISGTVVDGPSPGISERGRWVVFESRATDLVSLPDANGDQVDVFVRDMVDHGTKLVSIDLLGTASGDAASHSPVMSPDGRWITFVSSATDLVPESSGGFPNVYLYDAVFETTELVSVATSGTSGGNGASSSPIVAHGGSWVVFESEATDLVAVTDLNGEPDLFAWSRLTGATLLLTENAAGTATGSGFAGAFQPALSDGPTPVVAFASTFTDLVTSDGGSAQDVFARRLPDGRTEAVSGTGPQPWWSSRPIVSSTGDWIAFTSDDPDLASNDFNDREDCFVRDAAGLVLVSRNATGTASANDYSTCTAVNGDRGFVVFQSPASDLVANDTNADTDVFVRQVRAGITSLVSPAAGGGNGANGSSFSRSFSSISRNGRFIAFESFATDLEGLDGDTEVDVFVRDHCLGTTVLMNPNLAGTGSGNNESDHARISENGRWVTFSSRATDLVANDGNGWIDTFRSEVPGWGDWGCGALDVFLDGFESGDTSAWSP